MFTHVRDRRITLGDLMAECSISPVCPFFNHEVSYSPELVTLAKARFCWADAAACARLRAARLIGPDRVPRHLLPFDADAYHALAARAGTATFLR
ncbi:MAG: hypothetical protein Kow0067_00970 [Coriobacteriia bacterium]